MFGVLLFLTPAVSASFTGSEALRAYLFTLAGVLGLVVPVVQLVGDGVLLAGLRRGRCLEEILATRTTASEIVDQVACHGILSVLRLGLLVILPVMAALVLFVPAANRNGTLLAAALWAPAVTLVVWVGSCLVQAAVAWSGSRNRYLWTGAAVLAALLLAVYFSPRTLPGLALAASTWLLVGWGARALARAGLERCCSGPAARRRPPLPEARAARLENPIAYREASRLRPEGRGLLAVALLLWAGLSLAARSFQVDLVQPLAWMALVVIQPLRASLCAVEALALEREGETLEPLVLSGLRPRDFVDGWAAWSALPRAAECLVLALAVALAGGPSEALGTLSGLPLLVLKVGFGAYLGLLVSTLARTRREAWSRLFLAWVAACLALSLVPGAASTLVMPLFHEYDLALVAPGTVRVMDLAFTLAGLVAVRWLALARVRQLFRGGQRGRLR